MATVPNAVERGPGPSRVREFLVRLRSGDEIAHLMTLACASAVMLVTFLIAFELYSSSAATREQFGWQFLWGRTWDPVFEDFGALPFLYGTVITSALALLIAVPMGLGAAIFLAELAPPPGFPAPSHFLSSYWRPSPA